MDNATTVLERVRSLHDRGMLGAFEWEQRQTAVLDAETQSQQIALQRLDVDRELKELQSARKQLLRDRATQANDTQRRIADIAQASARNATERAIVLRAPRAGIVTGLVAYEGQAVASGIRLAAIVPAGSPLQAQLWLPSRAIGSVATGDHVLLRYHAFPFQQFGQQRGRVIDVARSALSPDDLERLRGHRSDVAMYRVTVALEQQDILAFGKRRALRTDMSLDADIALDRRYLYEWFLQPMKEFTPQAPNAAAGPA